MCSPKCSICETLLWGVRDHCGGGDVKMEVCTVNPAGQSHLWACITLTAQDLYKIKWDTHGVDGETWSPAHGQGAVGDWGCWQRVFAFPQGCPEKLAMLQQMAPLLDILPVLSALGGFEKNRNQEGTVMCGGRNKREQRGWRLNFIQKYCTHVWNSQ